MRKTIKQYALEAILMVFVVAIVVVVVYLAKGEKITSILINKNSMLAGAGTVYVPALVMSSYIVTPYAINQYSSQYSCDGVQSPRCQILSVASEQYIVTRTELQPYAIGNYTLTVTDRRNYTSQFSIRYGINGCTRTEYFDSREDITIFRDSCTGPKGYTSDPVEIPGPPIGSNGWAVDTSARGVAMNYGTYGGGTRTVDTYTPTEVFTVKNFSSKLLVVDGNSTQKYKVTLSVDAKVWLLSRPDINGSNPRTIAGYKGILCRNIRIAGKALYPTPDNDCQVQVLINGRQTLDVTPIVRGPLYGYDVKVKRIEMELPSV